jgi:hypothetical protein
MFRRISLAILALLLAAVSVTAQNIPGAQGNPSILSRPGGSFYAAAFNWQARVISGNGCAVTAGTNTCSGGATSGTVVIAGNNSGGAGGVVLPDGSALAFNTVFNTLTPIIVDWGQANAETVTPTAVSISPCPAGNLGVGGSQMCASVTASFLNSHGQSAVVYDGTYGLQTAINMAQQNGGGMVVADPAWTQAGGTTALITSAVPFVGVVIYDVRSNTPAFWNVEPLAVTYLAVPTVLSSSTAVFSTSPAGSYTTAAAYFMCIQYVDIAGQEGACSTTFSQTPATTLSSLTITAPAASTGAVGYTIYVSLTSGTYSLAYQVPLTASVCTLTKLENITPACAVTNSTYNQTGSNAVVTALTVSTSPVDMQLGGVSGTLLTGNPNGRTSYGYVPSSHFGGQGVPTVALAFTVGGIGSATPISIGTVNLPANFMNYSGKRIRVCGRYQNTDVNSVLQSINIYWDAALSNIAGSPVKIGSMSAGVGPGTAAAYTGIFCEEFTTTVTGAGATSSITPGWSLLNYFLTATPASNMLGGDTNSAAVGLLTTAAASTVGFSNRLSIVHTNTTGNNTPQLFSLTIEVL